MPLALVIDPEVGDRTRHAHVLRRVPGISVVAVGTLRETLEVIALEAPTVVMTAATLGDADASGVLEAVRERCEPTCCIVLEAAAGEAGPLPSDPAVHRIVRPVEARQVRKIVQSCTRATLDRQPLFRPPEYLQLLCLGGHSAKVQCFVDERPLGEIRVFEGAVWSAHDADGEGEDALRRLLTEERAVAVARPLGERPPHRDIERRWEQLLLEAAQEQDEARRGDEDEVQSHLKAASSAVLRGELQRAADEFAAAASIAPDDPVIRHNVQRLERLGYHANKEPNGD